MIAEIHNKLTTGEDQLTGNFFGSLRYLPFNDGMKPILQKSVFPTKTLDCIDSICVSEWYENICFWGDCRCEGTEPDVVIELDDIVILIEVKLDSGIGENQLEREAELLLHQYPHCSNKFLILLAREPYAEGIYEEYREVIKSKGVGFGYLTWEKALVSLNGINAIDPFQKVIVNDLIALLVKKGFEGFRCFNDYLFGIDPNDGWVFSYDFCFENYINMSEVLYYEFK